MTEARRARFSATPLHHSEERGDLSCNTTPLPVASCSRNEPEMKSLLYPALGPVDFDPNINSWAMAGRK